MPTGIWDLVTGEQRPFPVAIYQFRWLTPTQMLVDTGTRFVLVTPADEVVQPVPVAPESTYTQPAWQQQLRDRWYAAERVYRLQALDTSSPSILTFEHGQPMLYFHPGPDTNQVADVVAIAPPTTVDVPAKDPWRGVTERDRIPSRDHQLIATIFARETGRDVRGVLGVRVTTPAGVVVAEAQRPGWDTHIVEWAADNSGVYIQIVSNSDFFQVSPAVQPLYKLRPQTAAEVVTAQRW